MATVSSVNTIFTDLYVISGTATNETVEVLGYYEPGDGGGGTFYWDSGSIASDNTGTVINPGLGGSPGRWMRVFDSTINVRWFGAIISAASGLSDVTDQVHAARDFASNGGTIYFPQAKNSSGKTVPYVGAFVFSFANGEVNLLGDGEGSELKSNGTTDNITGDPIPVLRLGLRNLKYNGWRMSKVSSLAINGTTDNPEPDPQGEPYIPPTRFSDGVEFEDVNSPTYTVYSGRWLFEEVTFRNCKRAIYKSAGNIGNTYSNCLLEYNDFGYFATDNEYMHAGCDRFLGGHIEHNDLAGICVINKKDEYGQLIVDGTIIESNAGFGIFVKSPNTGTERMLKVVVDLRDVWTESNGNAQDIEIDNITYPVAYDYYFEQIRSVAISGSFLRNKLKAVSSSILLTNCMAGDVVDIDNESSIVADALRYQTSPSENLFVNSISYDGLADIKGYVHVRSSVWGPLRVVTQTGNNNILISQQYSGDSVTFDNVYNINATPADIFLVNGGILNARCTKISLPTGYSSGLYADNTNVAALDDDTAKYYVWSIHSYCCGNVPQNVTGSIGTLPTATTTNIQLGQIILKSDQWVCSYGVKKLIGDSLNPPVIALSFDLTTGANILFADFQVIKFDSYYDAQSFLNSRAFAEGASPCEIEEG
ncbi:MAG TPA: hypothetical protein VL098_02520 [Flavipsychrobacter sp.]|nr:hypothetical protein [Flavipsychrobacter sp.]